MGVYVYSIRAKTVSITMPSGDRVKANLYSYAYKLSSMWRGDYGYNSYRLTEENTERHSSNVFSDPRSGIVIVGDAKDDLTDHCVYSDVTSARWWDTDSFPGKLLGWVAKDDGKSLRIADRTRWGTSKQSSDGVTWKNVRSRNIMVDGKSTYVCEELADITT